MKRRTHKVLLYALLMSRAGMGFAQNVPVAATQLPTGGNVVGGQASIQAAGAAMTVNQTSARAVIDWNTFNIGSQAKVNFNQPSPSAVVLNRVLDSNPSQILGQLSATGQVFISNPSGVIFGTSARVDVGGLVATTQGMSTADFMAGKSTFSGGNADASVLNQGTLQAALGGYIALLAPKVRNEGVIVAREGTVALAAGASTTLDFSGTRLVSVIVEQPVIDALIENKQLIRAEGGYVVMSARSATTLMRAVINNTGSIQAPTLVEKQGRIVLEGGTQGVVQVGGNLSVSASDAAGKGGSIIATGDKVLVTADARLDATGPAGGGKINIGGGWQGQDASIRNANAVVVEAGAKLDASATATGNGGEVVVYSNTQNTEGVTRVAGELLARGGANGGNGGRIETSGHWVSTEGATGDARAPKGEAGQWLFDPYNVSIVASPSTTNNNSASSGTWTPSGTSSTILNTAINSLLDAGTNVTVTTGSSGAEAGNITVDAPIAQSATAPAARLTLNANQDITINQAVTMTKSGSKLELLSANTGGKIDFKADVNADTLSMSLTGSNSTVSQDLGKNITTSNLRISGADTAVSLFNPTNNIGIVAANVKSIALGSDTGIDLSSQYGKGLYVGSVEGISGISATGAVNLSSNSNIFLTQNVATTSTGNDAITLNAGTSLLPGANTGSDSAINPYGPNVILTSGKTITTGTGGRATIYMGSASGSGAALASYISSVSGSARLRYNSDEGITRFTALSPTASGLYAILRENPVLTVTANNSSMVYASAASPSTSSTVTGFINGDTLAQSVSTGATIAVGGTLSAAGYHIAGSHTLTPSAAAGDLGYGFTYVPGTLTVTPKTLTPSATVAGGTKVYDGTTAASTQLSLTGIVTGGGHTDDVSVASTSSVYNDKNVGTSKAVTVSGLTLSGLDAANYSLSSTTTGATGNITQKSLTASYSASNKVYDGSTSASVAGSSSNIVSGDVVTFSQSAAFQDASAGTGKTVNITSISLAGTDAGNYSLTSNTATALADISKKTITQAYTASNKIYDRSTSVTLTTNTSQLVAGDVSDVTFAYTSANFADWNAGNAKTVNINGLTMTGLKSSNYDLSASASTTTASITPKALSVSGISAANKVYDGTRTATVTASGALFSGLVAGDSISVTSTGEFVTKDVGTGKTVNLQNVYSGASVPNYSITDQVTTTANVSTAQLAVTATANDKVYDGNRAVVYALSSNKFAGDSLSITATSALFDTKDAGTGKTVMVGGIAVTGSDAANYTLQNTTTTTTAAVTPKALSVTGTTAAGKTYDSTNAATITVGTLSGFVGTETVTATATGTFDSANAGARTATAAYTLVNGTNGGLAGNYSLANTTAAATISKAALTVTGTTAASRDYDGTTNATITVGALSGFVNAETLTATATGTFDSKNAGARTATAVYTLVDGSGLASNYSLANTTANATINQRALTVSGLSAATRAYDATTNASLTVTALTGLVTGENLNVTATGTFDSANAGARTATATYSVANGTNGLASNYQLTSANGSTNGTITPKALTITGTSAASRDYDGGNTASMTVGTLSGFVGTETVTATATGTFDSANAGARTATAAYTLANGSNGGLAANYSLANTTAAATINPKALTVTGTTAANRDYDGTTNAAITVGTLSGFVAGESVSATAVGTFDSKNAGARTATAVYSLVNGTGLASNYSLANTTANATISPKALTMTGTTAAGRAYDGTTTAGLTLGTLSGFVGSETVTATATGVFGSKDAGLQTATATYTLANGTNGGLSANYSLANTTSTATITPRTLTVTGTTAANREYNGNTNATITVGTLSGFVAGEDVTATATGTFNSKDAGVRTATAVYTLADGLGLAANYSLANTTTTATIAPKTLTVTGTTAAGKVYDATTRADITVGTLSGFVNLETVSATATGTFDSKNAGTRTATAAYTLANGTNGGLASNYALANTTSSATITPKALTASGITANDKVYDGTDTATLNFGAATLSSGATNSTDNKYYSGDNVSINGAQAKGTFDSGPIWGYQKPVSVTNLALSGTDAGNYTVSDVSSAKADIRPVQFASVCSSGGTSTGCVNTAPTIAMMQPVNAPIATPSNLLISPEFAIKSSIAPINTSVQNNTVSITSLVGTPIPAGNGASSAAINVTNINSTQVQSMSIAQMRALPAATQQQLLSQVTATSSTNAVAALAGANPASATTLSAVRSLSMQELSSLSSTNVQTLLTTLSPQQLLSLTPAQVAGLSATSRAQLVQQISAAREARALTSTQIANLSVADVAAKIRLMSDTQLLALSDAQISALSQAAKNDLNALLSQNAALRQMTANQIALMPAQNLAVVLPYLDATQLMAITAAQTRALPQVAQQALNALLKSVADIRQLSNVQISALSSADLTNMIPFMSASQLLALSVGQVSALPPAQRQDLGALLNNIAQVRALGAGQIAAMSPAQLAPLLRFMSPAQLMAISDRQVSALPPAQVGELLAQLEAVASGKN